MLQHLKIQCLPPHAGLPPHYTCWEQRCQQLPDRWDSRHSGHCQHLALGTLGTAVFGIWGTLGTTAPTPGLLPLLQSGSSSTVHSCHPMESISLQRFCNTLVGGPGRGPRVCPAAEMLCFLNVSKSVILGNISGITAVCTSTLLQIIVLSQLLLWHRHTLGGTERIVL